jgi:hypothetical protein
MVFFLDDGPDELPRAPPPDAMGGSLTGGDSARWVVAATPQSPIDFLSETGTGVEREGSSAQLLRDDDTAAAVPRCSLEGSRILPRSSSAVCGPDERLPLLAPQPFSSSGGDDDEVFSIASNRDPDSSSARPSLDAAAAAADS